MSTPQAFISYRRTQISLAESLVDLLKGAGIQCFLDKEVIKPLEDFPERIRKGIAESHAFLALWSRDYGESDNCLAEFKLAWQHARRQSSDVERRIWVLNPETDASHITAGELNSKNFLSLPIPGQEPMWVENLLSLLNKLLPEGPLADERASLSDTRLNNVPHASLEFTGRNAELMRIHSHLNPAKIGSTSAVAVQTHGMGGIGKTELAIKYARDFAHAYPGGIYWLNLSSYHPGNSAKTEDAKIAWQTEVGRIFAGNPSFLRDPEGKTLSPEVTRIALQNYLRDKDDILWVLDNVPEITPIDIRDEVLSFWQAPSFSGRTLITTRDNRRIPGFEEVCLKVLNEEDALRLLHRHRPLHEHEMEDAKSLVSDLGAHTQALILIGEQLRDSAQGYCRALERLRETGRLPRIEEIAKNLSESLGTKARGIIAAFQLSIEGLDENAKRLLAFASVCATNEPIPTELLSSAFGEEDLCDIALSKLLRASLLSRRHEAGVVEIHPLVSDVARKLLAFSETEFIEKIATILLEWINDAGDIQSHASIEHYIRQAWHFARILENEMGVYLSLIVGHYESTRGAYHAAIDIQNHAMSLANRVLFIHHPLTLASMSNAAATQLALGNFSEAQQLLQTVLEIRLQTQGKEHPDTLHAMNALAETRRRAFDYQSAQRMHKEILEIRRRILGEEHMDTLISMGNLGLTYWALKRYSKAQRLHERVLNVHLRTLGEENTTTLNSMNNLASAIKFQGNLKDARKLQERVLSLIIRNSSKKHPLTSTFAYNLFDTYMKLKEKELAMSIFENYLSWLMESDPEDLCLEHIKIQAYLIRDLNS